MALKTFVDNIATQAIERLLIHDLGTLLSPGRVYDMDVELVTRIVAETPESQSLREELSKKLSVLRAGVETCRKYIGRKNMSTSD